MINYIYIHIHYLGFEHGSNYHISGSMSKGPPDISMVFDMHTQYENKHHYPCLNVIAACGPEICSFSATNGAAVHPRVHQMHQQLLGEVHEVCILWTAEDKSAGSSFDPLGSMGVGQQWCQHKLDRQHTWTTPQINSVSTSKAIARKHAGHELRMAYYIRQYHSSCIKPSSCPRTLSSI